MTTNGLDGIVDVSHWKPIVNMAAFQRQDGIAVIAKATNGTGGIDPQFEASHLVCEAAGVLFAPFHFGTGENPEQQCDHFLHVTAGVRGRKFLDLEPNPLGSSMTIAQAEAWVREFYRQMEYYPGLYTGEYYVKNVVPNSPLLLCDLWITGYEGAPIMPHQWSTWKLWQYTNGTEGPMAEITQGIGDGHVDRNLFNGTLDELNEWWYPTVVPKPVTVLKAADILTSPVGPDAYLTDGDWLPQPVSQPHRWFSANNLGNRYLLAGKYAIHTGVDLNLANDEDKDMNVYAAGNGTIIFADRIPASTWGNVVVQECTRPDGSKIWFRYAHLDAMFVVAGQIVYRADQIGLVGNAFNQLPFHLHFDATLKNVLTGGVAGAAYWPGDNYPLVIASFIDPRKLFIQNSVPVTPAPPVVVVPTTPPPTTDASDATIYTVTAPLGIHLRSAAGTAASSIQVMKKGTQIWIDNPNQAVLLGGYLWYQVQLVAVGIRGWAARGPIDGSETWF